MYRSNLRLRAAPGRRDDVVALLTGEHGARDAIRYGSATAVEVLVGEPDEIIVSALWESRRDYQDWQSRQDRSASRNRLAALLSDEPVRFVHRVLLSARQEVESR